MPKIRSDIYALVFETRDGGSLVCVRVGQERRERSTAMAGGARNGAAMAVAPIAGSKRVVGTIAEAAAIARAAAGDESAPAPILVTSQRDRGKQLGKPRASARAEADAGTPCGERDGIPQADDADSVAPRGGAVGAVIEKPNDHADTTAHLILAERAYAYGRSIVETNPEDKKLGDKLAIES
jgi:hypothetical protein